jgi:hypothetical protein
MSEDQYLENIHQIYGLLSRIDDKKMYIRILFDAIEQPCGSKSHNTFRLYDNTYDFLKKQKIKIANTCGYQEYNVKFRANSIDEIRSLIGRQIKLRVSTNTYYFKNNPQGSQYVYYLMCETIEALTEV